MLSFTLEPACVTSTLFLIDFHDHNNEKMIFIACHISEHIPLNRVKLNLNLKTTSLSKKQMWAFPFVSFIPYYAVGFC